jgi:L-iditol 2-dehydrogenase
MKMTGVLVSEIGDFQIKELPIKNPQADEIVVKVDVTGMCRTDLKIIRFGHRDLVLPRVPGEEVVGTIQRKGDRVAELQAGDRVFVYPGIWCGECPACIAGAENLCRGMKIMGFHRDGGFAQFVTVPAKSAIKISRGLSPDHAVFAEPLSCCLNALQLARIDHGQTIGIWGGGPAGTLLARAAAAMGAIPTCIEIDERRRDLISGLASCPEDMQFDICIVAVGSLDAYQEAMTHLNPRGRLVIFSGLPPNDRFLALDLNQMHYMEQTVVGAYGCSFRHGQQALELISTGSVSVDDMISHRLPLTELTKALELVETRQGMKILLYP